MSSKLVLAPSFRLLSRRLLTELGTRAGSKVLAPRWVVTPGSALAAQLRVDLARASESGILPAIRVTPLLAFIERLAELTPNLPGPRWSPLLEIHLHDLVAHGPLGPRLLGLRASPGNHILLKSTFLDLVDAGFGLDELDLLHDLAEETDLEPMAAEVLTLYSTWLVRLAEQGVPWGPLFHQSLPEAIANAPEERLAGLLGGYCLEETQVWVHGFYDFTDVAAGILTALGRRVPTTFLLPFSGSQGRSRAHPAFGFLQPVFDDLSVRLGTSLIGAESLEADSSDPVRFFLSTFPEGPIGPRPAFLTFQHASGLRAEVLSAALAVRRWLDDTSDPLRAEEVMLVAPAAEPYTEIVREVFQAFSIPLRMVDVPDLLPPGDRVLRSIAKLWEEQAQSERLLGYCREFTSLPCLRNLDLDRFEVKIRSIGFDGRNWPGLLAVADQLNLSAREKEFVDEVVKVWTGPEKSSPAQLSVSAVRDRLERIADRWVPDPQQLAPFLELFSELNGQLLLPLSVVLSLIAAETGRQTINQSAEKPGVVFTPLMRSRGLTARGVILLGLASGRVPFQIEEDPLLADVARLRLSRKLGEVGHRLAPKSAVSEEMALLFMLVNGSAERIHWVIPQTDENGRTVAATPWVQRYLQRWQSPPVGFDPIPRGPARQAELLLALDPERGGFLPPAFGAYLDAAIGGADSSIPYAFLLSRTQQKNNDLSWNGVIPAAALPQPGTLATVRVTELERLAKCPFQFYSRQIADWEPLSPLEFSQELKSTEWGTLIHRLFDLSLRSYQGTGVRTSEIARGLLADECALLREHVYGLPTSSSVAFMLLPPLFQHAARTKLRETARQYWEAVRDGTIKDGQNVCTETRCSTSYPDLPGIVISGQIDRLDDRGDRLVVIDYKSGREPEHLAQDLRYGFRLQPSLYTWLHRRTEPDDLRERQFCYVFFSKPPFEERAVSEGGLSIDHWLGLFATVLRSGKYLTTSREAFEILGFEKADPCQYCEFVSLCRRFERRAAERGARLLEELLPGRLEAMRQE